MVIYGKLIIQNMPKLLERGKDFILGKNTEVMSIMYFSANDVTDTLTWLEHYTVQIADSIGLIFRTVGETSITLNLLGAVINGKQLGDTTLVTAKERNEISSG